MPFYLEKEKTESTPYALVDEEKKYIKLAGRSFHEHAAEFFLPITEWLDIFLETDFCDLTFDCAMDYFNSSTVKTLHNMLKKMDRRTSCANKITVNWITTSHNKIIIECGEDFQDDFSRLEINMVIH
jgi:hypothetical protein